jgi:hypothetical protein
MTYRMPNPYASLAGHGGREAGSRSRPHKVLPFRQRGGRTRATRPSKAEPAAANQVGGSVATSENFSRRRKLLSPAGARIRVGSEPRLLGSRHRDDWSADVAPSLGTLEPHRLSTLAEAWLREAVEAHGHIGALSNLSLQLLAVGAPPGLLRASQRASLDAVAQAELCFGLASAFANRRLGPSDRSIAPLPAHPTVTSVALLAVRDGCVAQTITAMIATTAASSCEESISGVLRRLAAGATRRAGLAWRYLKWALAQDTSGRLARRVSAAFQEELAVRPIQPADGDRSPGWGADYGRLTHRRRAEIAARTMREIVLPCAQALLAESAHPLSA